MTALRMLSTTVAQSVSLLQGVALVVAPHGGQAGSRGNAVRAIEVDSARALDRRRADIAIRAAAVRHPCVHARSGGRRLSAAR